jgi:hypothetical protein
MQGLFRNVIGPWARRTGRAAMGWAEGAAGKGFSTMRSNAGIGWAALKANPRGVMSDIMGVGQLRGVGRMASNLRPGRFTRAGMGPGYYTGGNIQTLGPQVGVNFGRWATGAGFTGGARVGVGAARIGGTAAAADFLNPWGLGWGD